MRTSIGSVARSRNAIHAAHSVASLRTLLWQTTIHTEQHLCFGSPVIGVTALRHAHRFLEQAVMALASRRIGAGGVRNILDWMALAFVDKSTTCQVPAWAFFLGHSWSQVTPRTKPTLLRWPLARSLSRTAPLAPTPASLASIVWPIGECLASLALQSPPANQAHLGFRHGLAAANLRHKGVPSPGLSMSRLRLCV